MPLPAIHQCGVLREWSASAKLTQDVLPNVSGLAVHNGDFRKNGSVEYSYDECKLLPQSLETAEVLLKKFFSDDVAGRNSIKVGWTRPGLYATTTHKGSYSSLPKAYAHILDAFIPDSPYEYTGEPTLEIYLNDSSKVAETELLTEVAIPVRVKTPVAASALAPLAAPAPRYV